MSAESLADPAVSEALGNQAEDLAFSPGGAIALCRAGDVATGGGGIDETVLRGAMALSLPDGATAAPDGWFVLGANGDDTMEAVAVCAQTSSS